jgi:tetratricopeptide (TPR) repeat protein/uncharacterized coiled-coil protein SlyX
MSRSGSNRLLSNKEINEILMECKELIYSSNFIKASEILDGIEPSSLNEGWNILANFLKAKSLHGSGKFAESLEVLKDAEQKYSSIIKKKNEESSSASASRKAVDIDMLPDNFGSVLYTEKCHLLTYFGDYKQAIISADKAISYDSKSIMSYALKVNACKHVGDYFLAEKTLKNAITIIKSRDLHGIRDYDLDMAKSLLARYSNEYEISIKYANYAIKESPELSGGYSYKAIANLMSAISDFKEEKEYNTEKIYLTLDNPKVMLSLKDFEIAITKNPNDSLAYFYKGLTLESTGHIAEAIFYYEKALSITPTYFIAAIGLSNLLYMSGREEDALRVIEEFSKLTDNDEIKLEKAKLLELMEKFTEASDTYNELIAKYPESYEYYQFKARTEYLQNNFEDALALNYTSLDKNPDNVDALYNIFQIFFAQHNYLEAYEAINAILKIEPLSTLGYQAKSHLLAEVATSLDDKAFEFFLEFSGNSPTDQSVVLAKELMSEERFEDGKLAFYNFITKDNIESLEKFNLALEKFESGSLDEYEENLREAITINPDFAYAKFKLAELLKEQGKIDESEAVKNSVTIKSAEYFDSISNQRDILPHTKIFRDLSIASIERANEIEPDNLSAMESKVSILLRFDLLNNLERLLPEIIETLEKKYAPGSSLKEFEKSTVDNKIKVYKILQQVVSDTIMSNPESFDDSSEFSDPAALDLSQITQTMGEHATEASKALEYGRRGIGIENFNLRELNLSLECQFGTSLSDRSQDHEERASAAAENHDSFMVISSPKLLPPDETEGVSDARTAIAAAKLKSSVKVIALCKNIMAKTPGDTSFKEILQRIKDLEDKAAIQQEKIHQQEGKIHQQEEKIHELDSRVDRLKPYLKEIEKDVFLEEYYKGFVSTLQKICTGLLARTSGEVEAAQSSISALPLGLIPVIGEALEYIQGVVAIASQIREDNKATLAVKSMAIPLEFMSEIAPRIACKMTLEIKKDAIQKCRDDSTIFSFSGIFQTLTKAIWQESEVTAQAKLGAEDAIKLISLLKTGEISVTSLTEHERTAERFAEKIASLDWNIKHGPELPKSTSIHKGVKSKLPLKHGTSVDSTEITTPINCGRPLPTKETETEDQSDSFSSEAESARKSQISMAIAPNSNTKPIGSNPNKSDAVISASVTKVVWYNPATWFASCCTASLDETSRPVLVAHSDPREIAGDSQAAASENIATTLLGDDEGNDQ